MGGAPDEPVHDLRPAEPRWTHVALRVDDIDATIAWYEELTPLALVERREDEFGYGAWLAMPEASAQPFILVVAQFFPATDPFAGVPKEVLAPFAHLGIEVPDRADVDEMAARGEAAGCLALPPTEMPPPVGYICMLRDPDGNMVEYSWDQGVYAAVQAKWGGTPT